MNSQILCFDARMADFSGIGTYIQGLLGALPRELPNGYDVTLIINPKDERFKSWKTLPVASGIYSLGEQVSIPRAFRRSSAALLHAPHYNLPAMLVTRCIVTVHDLIHLKFPEFLPSRAAYLYAWTFFHRWVPQARAILTVSEHTKKDLIEMLHIPEHKITVTPPGVPEGFRPMTPSEYQPLLDTMGLKKGYFLYVGNLKKFKNVQRLLQAYKVLRQKFPDAPPLVFVGRNFIAGFDQEMQSTPSVTWFSEMHRSQLPAIYAGARALIFPSLYEGFGLPPLEAMACGTPVICSNRASLPEVVGDAAILVDPLDQNGLVAAMRHLWEDPSYARRLSERGVKRAAQFSWRDTARKTFAVYERCLS